MDRPIDSLLIAISAGLSIREYWNLTKGLDDIAI